jgi:hypothetical protein
MVLDKIFTLTPNRQLAHRLLNIPYTKIKPMVSSRYEYSQVVVE